MWNIIVEYWLQSRPIVTEPRRVPEFLMGYWEPHTSSIDFCEPNYLLTPYIAEPHNAFSSLAITALGLIGLLYGNPTQEWRFVVMYGLFAAVGLGSFALHTTLGWLAQSLDEIPINWVNATYIYSLIEMQAKKSTKRIRNVEWYLLAFVVLQTIVYYQMRTWYLFFIITYTSTAAIVTLWAGYLVLVKLEDKEHISVCRTLYLHSLACYVVIGCVVWLLDMRR